MTNIDLVTQLGFIIEKLTKAEDFKIANELSHIQINLINERAKAWDEGFDTGYALRQMGDEMKSYVTRKRKS